MTIYFVSQNCEETKLKYNRVRKKHNTETIKLLISLVIEYNCEQK